MKSGLYALASLDGSPLKTHDLRIMDLEAPENVQGFASHAVDGELGGRAVAHTFSSTERLLFLGHLVEPENLAAALGVTGPANPAALALHALHKWAPDEALAHMPGEWSLLHWDLQSRTLLAGVSRDLRDTMHFATNDHHVAIAPGVRQLCRLSWTDLALDPLQVMLQTARAPLRLQHMSNRTVSRHVTAIEPGTFCRFQLGRPVRSFAAPAPASPPAWEGSFEDAVHLLEISARQVVREMLARHGTVAIFLSGGLDSSLLAWLAAEERRAGQTIFCLTSVALPDNGQQDEREAAGKIAGQLGLPVEFVAPAMEASPYRPNAATFVQANGPTGSARHYLYDALLETAHAGGAEAVLDGIFGESSLTRAEKFFSPSRWLRHEANALRETVRARIVEPNWPAGGFHVQYSRATLSLLPGDLRKRRPPLVRTTLAHRDAPLGPGPAYLREWRMPTATATAGVRRLLPYRDRRIQEAAAAIPARFTVHDGLGRALARAMLKGRVPEEVRLNTRRMPFSPDYRLRLKYSARAALERLENCNISIAAEWIDLDWLSGQFQKLSSDRAEPLSGQSSLIRISKIQMTMMMVEFLQYWKTPG